MPPIFTILGCRGTMPVAGKSFVKYGGLTTCFSLKTSLGIVIVDAGTGLFRMKEDDREELPPAALLFTHFHLDHIMALPFLKRFHNPGSRVTLIGSPKQHGCWRGALMKLFAPPYWPVPVTRFGAKVVFRDLPVGKNGIELHGIRISWCPLSHPQGCLAYRLETGGKSVAIVTDHESGAAAIDDALAEFCSGVDFLIHDAQYTPSELKYHRGWGHSTWQQAVRMAARAKVRKLILTHHDVGREDREIDKIVANASRCFPGVMAARAGMTLF